jgi:hypothetical protein
MTRERWSFATLGAVASLGCASLRSLWGGGVDLETLGVSAERPSHVSVYLAARIEDRPLADLDPKTFRILEDGKPIDPEESQQTLLDARLVAEYRTLLLLDLSGPQGSGSGRERLGRAVAGFVAKLTASETVTVYAFAGDPRPVLVGDFPRSRPPRPEDVEAAVRHFAARDSSRDLGGALVEGSKELDARLMQNQKPFRIGTLVLFARGPDLAGRVEDRKVWDALDKSKHQIVALGLGDGAYLKRWGRSGLFTAQSADDLGPAFDEAADRVLELERSHYLVSYCSPARSGRRTLRIEVTTTAGGGEEKQGHVQEEFDSAGFGPGCNSQQAPRFLPPSTPRSAGSADQAPRADGKSKGDIVPPPETPDYGHPGQK